MSKKTRSAKGEAVDFDLLKIKEQIAAHPPAVDVRARQDFIDRRLRRRVKKVAAPAPKIHADGEAPTPKMPATEELNETTKMIDEVVTETKKPAQKARPNKAGE